jgi:phosphatidylinositol glycan class T
MQTRLRDKFQPRKARVSPHPIWTYRLTCPEYQPLQHHQCPCSKYLAQVAMRQLQSLLLVLVAIFTFANATSDYHEQLVLRPLQPSLLLASFNFQSNTSWASFKQQNFRYFPRSLGQILKHANTRELHLRFSLGQWDAESWGARPWGGRREGGTGVELWAWVEAETDEE